MLRNTKYLYSILSIAILLLAGSALWLTGGVMKESARVDNTPRDTLIGLASQTNYELHQLIYALTEFQRADSEISKQQLLNRFDVLWSREITNSSGEVGRAFLKLDGAPLILQKLRATLRSTEELIIHLEKGDADAARSLAQQYQMLVPKMQEISTFATYYATDLTTQLYSQFEKVNYWSMILITLMGLTSLIVSIIILNERRALKNLARHLEDRVDERTQDLKRANRMLKKEVQERRSLEAKLVQSQKMEIVGQLTGGIAHDFNNLLAIIQGNAELLLDYVSENDKKLVNPILRSSRRGSDLTARLLAFSRKQALKPETIDVSALICSITDMLDRSLGETVYVTLNAPEDLWLAIVDPAQLENAILNLAVNASQAMPKGGTVFIEPQNERITDGPLINSGQLKPGDYVCLKVTDSGTGMSEEVKTHAFEPFFTTKEVGKGSGLGLSMVYGFAQQSGGAVDIVSKLGAGTTVKIYLPRSLSKITASTNAPQAAEIPKGDGELVLVLEDDPQVLELTQKLLSTLNYDVIVASNLKDALTLLKQQTPIDVILSDVILPGGQTGPAFFEEHADLLGQSKLLFMSGYPADATQNTPNSPSWSADKILLNKPFTLAQLATQIHSCLQETPPSNKKA